MSVHPLIVGIGGTTRPGSSTELALLVALEAARAAGARTEMVSGAELQLPMYDPAVGGFPEGAKRLVELTRACQGMIIASPGYHGTMSGMIKNAMDYIEELRTDERPYLHERAVGCIACAYGWQATGTTLVALRTMVHSLRGWPTPLGAAINSALKVFDEDGTCIDASARMQLEIVGQQVVEFAKMRAAVRS